MFRPTRGALLTAWICLSGLAARLGAAGSPMAEPMPPRTFAVVGYLPSYHMRAFDPAAAPFLTDLIYFSLLPRPSGELDLRHVKVEDLRQLRALRERHHFRLLIAVGGGDIAKGFAACTADPQTRGRFVHELARYCRANKLDGIDFDWEFPSNRAEEDAFAALLVESKRALQADGMLVTAAVIAGQRLRPDALAALDRLHLMSYDHSGRHSTLEQARADTKRLLAHGTAREKICLGVPFYGRDLKNHRRALTYAELVRRYHPGPAVDEVAGIYFNGIQTIQAKARYAQAAGLGGIMIWELGQDTPNGTSLLRAIHQVLESPVPPGGRHP